MKRNYYLTIVDDTIKHSPAVFNIITSENKINEVMLKHLGGWENLKYQTLTDEKTKNIQSSGSQIKGSKMFSLLVRHNE